MTSKKTDFGSNAGYDKTSPDKGSEELRGMMGDVMRQIADTERRNATLLKSMQERIETLNTSARTVRDKLPADHVPQFDRIESGMARIADRVSETSAKLATEDGAFRGFSNIPAFSSEAAAGDDPFSVEGILGSNDFEAEARSSAQSNFQVPARAGSQAAARPGKGSFAGSIPEPQPLRSAAGHHRPLSNGYRGHVDPFDIVESVPGNPADPWSSDSAEVLSEFYASGEPTFGQRPGEEAEVFASSPPRTAPAKSRPANAASFDQTAAPAVSALDKDWLEDRLADITVRLERTLSERRPDPSLAQFNDRLSSLEARIAAAMAQETQGYASDPAQFGQIEAQVQALAVDFEAARGEIARLQAIEEQLGALMRQFSDERMGAIVGRSLKSYGPAATSRAADELEAIALAAAEATVARLADAGYVGGGHGGDGSDAARRIEDLQSLVTGFIDERRQSEEQNVQIMDALQQAMLRVLDRLDSIDGGQEAGAAEYEDAQHGEAHPIDHDGRHYDRHASAGHDDRYEYEPEQPAQSAARGAAHAAPMAGERFGEAARSAPQGRYTPSERFAAGSQYADERHATQQHDDVQAGDDYGHAEAETEQGYAPAPRDRRLPTLEQSPDDVQDTIARQRASLQASAQRAQMAQRDKQREDAPALRKSGAKFGGRLMVSGLAIAAVLGFAAYMITSQSPETASVGGTTVAKQAPGAATGNPAATPTATSASTAQVAPVQAQAPQQQRSRAAAAVQQVPKQPKIIMPETVSEVDGVGIVTAGSEQMLVPVEPQSQFADFAIAAENALASGGFNAGSSSLAVPAVQPVETAALGKPSSALELPPATVGPLSMRIAAAKGDPSAEFEVASRLAEGKGTDQDLKEAYRWYQRSAAQGFVQAQYRLGTLYERGLGARADVSRARAMYQRAAEQGNVKSMHNLAVLAAGRGGASPDYTTAATWFTQAANHGLADSQYNLAVLTESGLGVQKDLVQAAMWFILAAQGGDKEALRRRDQTRAKLEKSEWLAAEKLAASWQPMVPDKLANDARFAGELWKSRQAAAAAPQVQ